MTPFFQKAFGFNPEVLQAREKNQINSAFMMVSLVVINITQYAYAVPLVSNTVEDGYGQ